MLTSLLALGFMAADARPTARQLAWHASEYYAFVHFGPTTFTGEEGGHGTEDPRVFNPSKLDCRQWARTFRAAGMSGVIVTAKHHDGYCLWPSTLSNHTVAKSPWRNGKGDVLRELSEACRAEGLKMGVYLSPWDRNHPTYGTPAYNDTFVGMLKEVLTGYGPIFEVWFDGANGEGPNGKRQVYDWPRFVQTVRDLQPNAVIFSDAGPDIRWVGNEDGFAGETNWGTLRRDEFAPGTPRYKELTEGHADGTHWVPAECDVSIRPGWFWRATEDDKVKSVDRLMEIWYGSVGRGASLLLNVPPNSDGLISQVDVDRLMAFRQAREADLAHPLAAKRTTQGTTTRLDLDGTQEFDLIELREDVARGQRVRAFEVNALVDGQWQTLTTGTTINVRRLLKLPRTRAQAVELKITKSFGLPQVTTATLYRRPS